MKHYKAVVIGAGPGGYEAALELGKNGIQTLIVEKEKAHLGGTCLNEGCIPAKNYLESAEFVTKANYFRDNGIELEIKNINLSRLKEKTKTMLKEIRTGIAWQLEQLRIETIFGTASFVDANTIAVNSESISFDYCIIATGSQVNLSPLLPVDGKNIITSDDVFELEYLPKSITIVGCGAIGCEFATFFSAFGVDVTMIGRKEQLLPQEDIDASKALAREFKKRGITLLLSSTVVSSKINSETVSVQVEGETNKTIESETVLCAMGRSPNIEGLKPENADVQLDEKGFIVVNEALRTTQPHIYAIGDCIPTLPYAHMARAEARITVHNIITGDDLQNSNTIPSVIFSKPQIASCGINEKSAKDKNLNVAIKKGYFKANPKAKISGDDSGFVKIVIDTDTDEILGATITGLLASEIIHEVQLAIDKKVTLHELRKMIHAHPTVSEIFTIL